MTFYPALAKAAATESHLLAYLQHMRQHGFAFGLAESHDALRALATYSSTDPITVKRVFRALLCQNSNDWDRFETVFDQYWHPQSVTSDSSNLLAKVDPRLRNKQNLVGLAGASDQPDLFEDYDLSPEVAGASRQTTIGKSDYRFITDPSIQRRVEYLADRLATKLKNQLTRRQVVRKHGHRINLRKSLRNNIRYQGTPLTLLYNVTKKNRPHLVILHDISYSMSWNNPLLFRFCRGLMNTFKSSHAFAFHTELIPVTHVYQSASLPRMRAKLEANDKLRLGGTCISRSIQSYLDEFARNTLNRQSIVIILSDGFDTDEPEVLADKLSALKSRCKAILWLNPMLGRENVSLTAEVMQDAYPEVDAFLSGNSLDGLRGAIETLARI